MPLWVFKVVERALTSDPGQRWPDMNAMLAALEADPAKRRRRIYLGVGAAATIGVAGWGVAAAVTPDETMCEDAAQHLVGIWDAPTSSAIEAAFVGVDKPYAEDAWTEFPPRCKGIPRRGRTSTSRCAGRPACEASSRSSSWTFAWRASNAAAANSER